MGIQDIDHRFLFESKLDKDTLNNLWNIYCEIDKYWDNDKKIKINDHKQVFRSFILNRIRLKPEYVEYYKIGVKVYQEYKKNNNELHQNMFVTPAANIHPFTSAKAMFKQKVINEFITFYLASGGFKIFNPDSKKENSNYAGYIGGENNNLEKGLTAPYLTHKENK